MSQSIGIKSSPTGPFVYVENVVGESLAFGSDNTAQMFVVNTSASPNVLPGSATANINFDPTANGNITFRPNGSGKINALNVASNAVSNKNYVTINTSTGELGSDNAPLSSISITGDTGGALTGSSFTFTGGTTGLSFGGSGSTETLTFAGITANGGTVSLATDATTSTINVGTGAGVKTSTFGSVNTTSATTVQSGSGALNVTATGGSLTINSGTGALSISNDASVTTVNLATGAAAKTVTLGSTNTTSSLALKYGTSDFTLASATGTVMSALDTGEITYPLQPAFLAIPNATISDVTGDGTRYVIIFNTEIFDQNSDYNTGTGQFTAPVTGRYQFYGSIAYGDIGAAHNNGSQIIDTSNREYLTNLNNPTTFDISGFLAQTLVVLADMDAGDTAELVANVSGSTKTVDIFYQSATDPRSWFSGSLVC